LVRGAVVPRLDQEIGGVTNAETFRVQYFFVTFVRTRPPRWPPVRHARLRVASRRFTEGSGGRFGSSVSSRVPAAISR
jgi:hypothetical protein